MDDKFQPEDSPSLPRADVPADADHDELEVAVERCRACSLYKHATQAVLGEGPTPAKMMIIGEQPGDQEDLLGRPFVGPAGRLLDCALEEAEIPREQVYVTNAVKHFKWEPRGKRRLHERPNAAEVRACRGWLDAEILLVEPEIIVCLGATAAQIFLGRAFRLTESHGEIIDGAPWTTHILATYHPSAVIRMKPDTADYARLKRAFTLDLAEAASVVSFRVARARRLSVRSGAGA
jgi:uracil-DNA glycosylase